MAILRPDTSTTLNGVKINEYLLTKHNPNRIDMPSVSMEGKVIGVTVHNTDWISVASGTTPAEQYTRATVNGNMKDVRVHYYVDNTCAWQNLPHSLSGWHAADGSGNGNRRTIAIECIMSSAYNDKDKKSEDNCAKMAVAEIRDFLENGNITHSVNYPDCNVGVRGDAERITILHKNIPNMIGQFTTLLAQEDLNIALMTNKSRKEYAYTVIDVDGIVSDEVAAKIKGVSGVLGVRVIR